MNVNKTIASLALLISASSAQAIVGPGFELPQPNTACVATYSAQDGSLYLGDCDKTEQNERFQLQLNENGCADNQAKFESFNVKLEACTNIVQL